MRRVTGLGLGLLALSACVAPRHAAPPPAPPPPAPAPPLPVAAPPAADWRDRAYTPGDWSYAGGEARYGPLLWRCVAGQVAMLWSGLNAPAITVRTSSGDRVLPARPNPEGATLTLGGRDPLLDQIAFSRGRFMLEAGAQQLVLPTWPELNRVVEDCRN